MLDKAALPYLSLLLKENLMSANEERRTEYTLDVAKWRCGGSTRNPGCHLGEGGTDMLNREGFMCCLGQFAEQAGIKKGQMQGLMSPSSVALREVRMYDPNFVQPEEAEYYQCTPLANRCMNINDAPDTSVFEKLQALSQALSEAGITLHIINLHVLKERGEEE